MRLSFLFGLIACFACIGSVDSATYVKNIRDLDTNRNGIYEEGEIDPCGEYQTGPSVCYCPVTKFKPKRYCTPRCVTEPYEVKVRCLRYEPKFEQRQYCRWVPQYYTREFCRYIPQYYYCTETRYRKKTVYDENCCYEPYTCIEKTCYDPCEECQY